MADVFTPEQIAQLLEAFFKAVGTRQYIGARYVPLFGRKDETSIEWDNSKPYEPLTVVLYLGNSYTSRQYVPAGVQITNEEFWANTGNYNAQVEQYRRETAQALQAAQNAQTSADNAQLAAGNAQQSADNAKLAADNAQQSADNAQLAANSANESINTLLPKANFSSENTVKDYIDTAFNNVNDDLKEVVSYSENNTANYWIKATYLNQIPNMETGRRVGACATHNGVLYICTRDINDSNVEIYEMYVSDFLAGNFANMQKHVITGLSSHVNDATYFNGYLYVCDWLPASNYRTVSKISVSNWAYETITLSGAITGFQLSDDGAIAMVTMGNYMERHIFGLGGNNAYMPSLYYKNDDELSYGTFKQAGCYDESGYRFLTIISGSIESQPYKSNFIYANGLYGQKHGLYSFPYDFDVNGEGTYTDAATSLNELQTLFLANGKAYVIGQLGGCFECVIPTGITFSRNRAGADAYYATNGSALAYTAENNTNNVKYTTDFYSSMTGSGRGDNRAMMDIGYYGIIGATQYSAQAMSFLCMLNEGIYRFTYSAESIQNSIVHYKIDVNRCACYRFSDNSLLQGMNAINTLMSAVLPRYFAVGCVPIPLQPFQA